MSVGRIGSGSIRLVLRSAWLRQCAAVGLLALAAIARCGEQASASQALPLPAQALKPEASDSAVQRKQQIAQQSADLLRLANSLKAEMDKAGKETLSVAVVRRAGEIEQLAHRMRSK